MSSPIWSRVFVLLRRQGIEYKSLYWVGVGVEETDNQKTGNVKKEGKKRIWS
jgi:hypothetical protein